MAFNVTPSTPLSEAHMFHGCRVRRSGPQTTVPRLTHTVVDYDAVLLDTDNFWDTTNFQIVIPEGVYACKMTATSATTTNRNGRSWLRIYKNADAVAGLQVRSHTNTNPTLINVATGPFAVVPGDVLDVRFYHDTNAAYFEDLLPDGGHAPCQVCFEVIKTPIGPTDT